MNKTKSNNTNFLQFFGKNIFYLAAAIGVLAFLIWSRFYLLSIIPSTLPHDEIVYSIQARSYVVQGKTLDQSQSMFTLRPFDGMYAELPATIMSLGFLISDDPLIASHVVSAIMGVTLPFLFSWLLWGLWKNKQIALAGIVLATFNPLLWQFSRLSYDAFYSLWFYVTAGAFFVQDKKKMVWFSAVIFFLGFFQYQGFKLLLVPWVGLLLVLKMNQTIDMMDWKTLVKSWKKTALQFLPEIIIILSAVALTLFYGLVLLPSQSNVSQRLDDIIFTDTEQISTTVDQERRLSIQSPYMKFANNKGMGMLSFMLGRLLGAFNPFLLFMIIEPGVSAFSVWVHGIFYWIEGVWMILGAIVLGMNKRKRLSALFLAIGLVVLSFPTLINTGSNWHLLRTMLSYFTLLFFAVWGMVLSFRHSVIRWFTLGLYIFSIANFAYIYFYRYPVISLDWGNFHERLIARYVALTVENYPDRPVVVHSSMSDYMFWSYLLYSQSLTPETVDLVAEEVNRNKTAIQKHYRIGNLDFTDECYDPFKDEIGIVEVGFKRCGVDDNGNLLPEVAAATTSAKTVDGGTTKSLLQVKDSGLKFFITHDKLCEYVKLSSFIHPKNFENLRLEKLPPKEFCEVWVSDQQVNEF